MAAEDWGTMEYLRGLKVPEDALCPEITEEGVRAMEPDCLLGRVCAYGYFRGARVR